MVPDEEDDQEDTGKQPEELEDMLELFREPEEPPRPGVNPLWLVLILIAVIGGCWLAVVGVQAFVREMTELQGGPAKGAKSAERPFRPGPVSDVAAAFRERAAKGMSKDEVRWILEDFEKTGIPMELDPLERALFEEASANDRELLKKTVLKIAAREQDWYADALAEGLMLDGGQKIEMRQKLAAAFVTESKKFERLDALLFALQEGKASEEELKELKELYPRALEAAPFVPNLAYCSAALPELWLKSEDYAPWNLCKLSANQLALTNYARLSAQHGENAGNWLTITAGSDPGADELLPSRFRLWGQAACIVPFAAAQLPPRVLSGDRVEDDKLGGVTKLNPAQFKLVLLFQPDLAEELMPLLGRE